jgi:hypothetical protein
MEDSGNLSKEKLSEAEKLENRKRDRLMYVFIFVGLLCCTLTGVYVYLGFLALDYHVLMWIAIDILLFGGLSLAAKKGWVSASSFRNLSG